MKKSIYLRLNARARKFLAALLVAALAIMAVKNIADGDVSRPLYADVPVSHWAFEGVQYCGEHGLLNGIGGDVYAPDAEVSTAQLATVLVRLLWNDESTTIAPDITLDTWWSAYMFVADRHGLLTNTWIGKAQEEGITLAWRSQRVELPISRYEMALIFYNFIVAVGIDLPNEGEINETAGAVGDYSVIPQGYRKAVLCCVRLGLIAGVDAKGAFAGTGYMNRAQLAVIMERMHRMYGEELKAVAADTAETVTQSPKERFPTTGSTDTPNANGYYTPANVSYGSAVLVYELLEFTNASRASEGLDPLRWVPYDEAEEYTLLRAYECSYAYGHTRPCGESETSVAVANIGSASSYTPPSSMHREWMASEGHRRAILGDYKYMCAAHCGSGWVVTFWNDYHFHHLEEYGTAAHNYHVKCSQGVFAP